LHSLCSEINVRHQISIPAMAVALFMISRAPSAALSTEDACAVLSQAQVSAALGVPVDAGKQIGPSSALCGWKKQPNDRSHTGKRVMLSLYRTLGKSSPAERFENGKIPMQGITKTPVSGVGDDAYYIDTPGLGIGLNVKKGASFFQVRVYGFPADQIRAIEKTLAQEVLGKL
jgi:hypothetical protein